MRICNFPTAGSIPIFEWYVAKQFREEYAMHPDLLGRRVEFVSRIYIPQQHEWEFIVDVSTDPPGLSNPKFIDRFTFRIKRKKKEHGA
jgi:hypothetical protein